MLGIDVGDLAGADLIPDASLQLFTRTPQEALAVAEAFVFRIQPAIDKDRHGNIPGRFQPALFTRMYQSTSRRT